MNRDGYLELQRRLELALQALRSFEQLADKMDRFDAGSAMFCIDELAPVTRDLTRKLEET